MFRERSPTAATEQHEKFGTTESGKASQKSLRPSLQALIHDLRTSFWAKLAWTRSPRSPFSQPEQEVPVVGRVVGYLMVSLGLACAHGVASAALPEQWAQHDARYATQLDALADECEAQGAGQMAQIARTWHLRRDPHRLYLFVTGPATLTHAAGTDEQPAWEAKFWELRRRQAEQLYQLAKQAAAQGKLSQAMIWLGEALREDPHHRAARLAMGYVEHQERWQTPYAARMIDQGKVWHPEFGWITKDDLARYVGGERPVGARWLAVDNAQQQRARIDRGWRVQTEHYDVRTNDRLVAGVQLATQLEHLQQVWTQVFAGYAMRPAEVRHRFATPGRSVRPTKRHRVVYYRTREEYNQALRSRQSNIEITLGIYFDREQTAYFFAGNDQHSGTLYHEATHQLFQETRRAARHVGQRDNFWIVEGIAAYFESLSASDGYYTLGGMDAGRVPKARERVLDGGFYLPLARLVEMGKGDLQRHPAIAKIYTQAAGTATFLMHYDGGRYREALVKYLQAVYSGKAEPATLARLTGANYAELDQQYRQYLRSGSSPEVDES